MLITSLSNEKVKYYTKLNQSKKFRDQENLFLVEGMHLVLEAYKNFFSFFRRWSNLAYIAPVVRPISGAISLVE